MEQGIALYDFQQHRSHIVLYGQDPGVVCRIFAAWAPRVLGYPNRAQHNIDEALPLPQKLAHPFSLAYVQTCAAIVSWFRREGQAAQGRAEEAIRLSAEQAFAYLRAVSMVIRGWAWVEQGQATEGMAKMRRPSRLSGEGGRGIPAVFSGPAG